MWEAAALNTVGWYAARLGDYDPARDHCQAALTLLRHHHDPDGEAATWTASATSTTTPATTTRPSTTTSRPSPCSATSATPTEVANTLDRLGHPHAALGQHEQARAVWQEALELYREQDRDDDAARVQRQLDDLDHPNPDHAPGQDEIS